MYVFTAIRGSTDGNILFPDRIEIDSVNVTYYKGYTLGHISSTIAIENIASVDIRTGIIFADVTIESSGGKRITVNGLRKIHAKQILKILTL